MKTIKIGSVPEHFNLPWHLSIENNLFKNKNIDVQWNNFPGGTGEMTKALREGTVDIAILLTEGIVKDITEGNPSKIIQTYIETPLIWGIHVAAQSKYYRISDLKNTTAAISRYGSGSHLMAYVNAQRQNWDTKNLTFKVIKNLNGAIEALPKGDGDYFMWEHFTTKPYVDQGIFRRIADCPTPWPCFVIAARNNILNTQPELVKQVLTIINQTSKSFKTLPNIETDLATRYHQKVEDITEWLKLTEWSQKQLSTKTLLNVQQHLLELNIINQQLKPEDILFHF